MAISLNEAALILQGIADGAGIRKLPTNITGWNIGEAIGVMLKETNNATMDAQIIRGMLGITNQPIPGSIQEKYQAT